MCAVIKSIINAGGATFYGMGKLRRPVWCVPLDRVGQPGRKALVVCEDGTGDPVTLMPAHWRPQ